MINPMDNRNLLTAAFLAAVLCLAAACTETPNSGDPLYQGFQAPPAQSRPFVRWWWNGNRVSSSEALRELDILERAGIGGVEVNAIAMPQVATGDLDAIAPALEWLSPEWNRVVRATALGAKERGMVADLIIGSGWPFGGRFLEPGEMLQIVTVQKLRIQGPARFSKPLDELTRGSFRTWDPVRREEIQTGSEPELLFLRLVPAAAPAPETGMELAATAVQGDQVTFEIPAGDYDLYAGSWREGFRTVVRGAPGADGPVVDHFNKDAVRRYLDRVSGRLVPDLGGKLGDHFRAVFCDSLELGEANWTGDFPQEFQARRGYDPMPWLHYMVDPQQPDEEDPGADRIRRLRHDFNLTISELFQERFLDTLVDWAQASGVRARVQAYGRETHSVDSAMRVDLPEGETWIWGGDRTPFPTVGNRLVASAAHLAGRRIVSAESMTNTVSTFQTLPFQLKLTGDLSFLSGINHFILHGFNFSPPEAGFPGWVQYGTYFSEHNSWWPYMRLWTDYAARVSWLLQNSEAGGRVAVLSPDADVWSDFGRPYYPFPEREAPLYAWHLWEDLHRAGYNADYISTRVLEQGDLDEGILAYGSRKYEVVLSPGLKRMAPAAAEQLVDYARAGGRIVFVERFPNQGPSYSDLGEGDARVTQSMAALRNEFSGNVSFVDAPPESALSWAAETMARAGLEPDVRFTPLHPELSQIHHSTGSRDIFLLVYSGLENDIEFDAQFPGMEGRTVWRWDPETGDRAVFAAHNAEARYRIRLEPLESLLLVFEPGTADDSAPRWSRPVKSDRTEELTADWTMHLTHSVTGEQWESSTERLFDLGLAGNNRLQSFAGLIVYRTEFEVSDTDWNWLELGTVHGVSEATLNGRPLGIRWYGRHSYPIHNLVSKGMNQLEIKVTTSLSNYARSATDNAEAQRWANWFPPEPTGMLGPVRLR